MSRNANWTDLFLEDRSVNDFVFRASRWKAEAPRVLPDGVRLLFGHLHRDLVPNEERKKGSSREAAQRKRSRPSNDGSRTIPSERVIIDRSPVRRTASIILSDQLEGKSPNGYSRLLPGAYVRPFKGRCCTRQGNDGGGRS